MCNKLNINCTRELLSKCRTPASTPCGIPLSFKALQQRMTSLARFARCSMLNDRGHW